MRFYFKVLLLLVFSCQDDIQTNNPTFQGLRHGDYVWKSTARTATVQSTGVFNISGSDGYGTMVISLPDFSIGTFTLGPGKSPTVIYTENNVTYSTQNIGNEYPVYVSDGEVTIVSIDVVNKTITGSFYFNSYDETGFNYMNFSEGVFFKVPYMEL
tara:strand:+ start:97 stop:564 length:468 start_codon:yes stop_codon:yes gene_type:complete